MDTLPVCRERGISYAAFSIADIRPDGESRIIENNPTVYLTSKGGGIPQKETFLSPSAWQTA